MYTTSYQPPADKPAAIKALVSSKASGAFPKSLIRQFQKKGDLSDKQWYWVEELVKPKEKPAGVEVGDLEGVYELFQKAMQHLKWPKIVLVCQGIDDCIRLGVCGQRSKYTGQINVTTDGAWGDRTYLGRIDIQGTFHPSWKAAVETVNMVTQTLQEFAADPAGVAAEHGKLTGNCCFCNTKLTDERSTEVGYGPVCAGHYGLPWGKKH